MKEKCKAEKQQKIKALKRVAELENILKFYQVQHSFPAAAPPSSPAAHVVNPFLFMSGSQSQPYTESTSVDSVEVPAYLQ